MIAPLAGLALGLAGSIHCVGMCGPIAISLPRTVSKRPFREVAERLLYNAGRVITYITLGALIGSGGNAIALAGYSRSLSIIAGIFMILATLLQLVWHRSILPTALLSRAVEPLKTRIGSLMKSHGGLSHLLIGILNGLLPCGLVTAALLGSLGTGSLSGAMLFMGAFGIGTVPLMAAVSIGGARLSCKARQRMRFMAPGMAFTIAVLFLLRGSALGIPYVSPSAPTTSHPAACCAK